MVEELGLDTPRSQFVGEDNIQPVALALRDRASYHYRSAGSVLASGIV